VPALVEGPVQGELVPVTFLEPQSSLMCCWLLLSVSKPPYLSRFMLSARPVASACCELSSVRGGVSTTSVCCADGASCCRV
jgi:hypothetical protein